MQQKGNNRRASRVLVTSGQHVGRILGQQKQIRDDNTQRTTLGIPWTTLGIQRTTRQYY